MRIRILRREYYAFWPQFFGLLLGIILMIVIPISSHLQAWLPLWARVTIPLFLILQINMTKNPPKSDS
jgi:hypothetical protein